MLRSMRAGFLEAVRRAGLTTTDGAIGVLATGSLDAETLRAFLKAMPDGDWELCCHPGYVDSALEGVRTRLRQSREIERQALQEVIPTRWKFFTDPFWPTGNENGSCIARRKMCFKASDLVNVMRSFGA